MGFGSGKRDRDLGLAGMTGRSRLGGFYPMGMAEQNLGVQAQELEYETGSSE